MSTTPEDERWMQRALELAVRGRGRTSPNPLVGAVLVKEGRAVAEGWHEQVGGPHAERVALARADRTEVEGSTLYVNLEPCSHHGRTPPCAPAVAEAGIRRVVSGMEDPDPRVRGSGHRLLEEHGLEVEVGVLESEAQRTNAEFVHRVSTGCAYGVLKAAVSLDGRLAVDSGDARWITGDAARRRAHELRDQYDAILVGRGTVALDDPSLDVRLPGERHDPAVLVVDSNLALPFDRTLWKRSKEGVQVVVFATSEAPEDRRLALEEAGVSVCRVASDEHGRVSLEAVFQEAASRGWNSVLVEGGPRIHTSLLVEGLAQRAHVFVAPRWLGGRSDVRTIGDLGVDAVADSLRLVDVTHESLGPDVLISGTVQASRED